MVCEDAGLLEGELRTSQLAKATPAQAYQLGWEITILQHQEFSVWVGANFERAPAQVHPYT